MTKNILIVEDENDLSDLIADYVRAAGFVPSIIANGNDALLSVRASMPDFIVLDIMLPGMDGLSICKAIRDFSTVPIIMVTAKVEEIDRLIGLEIGADDYLCKPFSPRELIARIKVILRRTLHTEYSASNTTLFEVNAASYSIKIGLENLELTRSEYAILANFIQHPGLVFSRTQLLDLANQDNFDVTDRAVDSHIKNLRRKLDAVLPDLNPIHSIYGVGYRFDI